MRNILSKLIMWAATLLTIIIGSCILIVVGIIAFFVEIFSNEEDKQMINLRVKVPGDPFEKGDIVYITKNGYVGKIGDINRIPGSVRVDVTIHYTIHTMQDRIRHANPIEVAKFAKENPKLYKTKWI